MHLFSSYINWITDWLAFFYCYYANIPSPPHCLLGKIIAKIPILNLSSVSSLNKHWQKSTDTNSGIERDKISHTCYINNFMVVRKGSIYFNILSYLVKLYSLTNINHIVHWKLYIKIRLIMSGCGFIDAICVWWTLWRMRGQQFSY